VTETKRYGSSEHPEHAAFVPELLKVEVESESRAIVVASEFESAWEQEEAETGTYVLTRTSEEQWAIKDRLKQCWKCDGAGKHRDFDRELADMQAGQFGTTPMQRCEECHGTGTISTYE